MHAQGQQHTINLRFCHKHTIQGKKSSIKVVKSFSRTSKVNRVVTLNNTYQRRNRIEK